MEVFQQGAAIDSRVKYRYRFHVRKEVLFVFLTRRNRQRASVQAQSRDGVHDSPA